MPKWKKSINVQDNRQLRAPNDPKLTDLYQNTQAQTAQTIFLNLNLQLWSQKVIKAHHCLTQYI